jgi:hypothetical protein
MKYRPLPSLERLNELFVYEPITGVLMRRMDGGRLTPCNTPDLYKKRDGSMQTFYARVKVDGRLCMTHRIVYKMHHGVDPSGFDIDHIDGCGLNNRIANLRLATRSQNTANTDSKNYTLDKRSGRFYVQVKLDGNNQYGGSFEFEEDALAAGKVMKKEIYGEYARV